MSNKVPADGARRRGKSKSRAVAGAEKIRISGDIPDCPDATAPSTSSGRSWGCARRAGQQRRRRQAESEWSLVVDLPERLPVLSAELAALEAHLGAAIDAILSARH